MAENFDKAVEHVRSLPKDGPVTLSNEEKLRFYSLYKQATEGDVTGAQPWAVQLEARAKWDAWNAVKGTEKDAAKKMYVEELITITTKYGQPFTA